MATAQPNAAILFADISGSTALYDKLGNEQALQVVTRTLGVLTREMAAQQGSLIKTIGDEIMCLFPDITTAINAACAMQQAVEKQRPGGTVPIYIRIGVHYGEVVLEGNDVFGDTVNVAARVTSITRARQILTTQTSAALLPAELRNKTRPVMRTVLRGKETSVDIFQVIWDKESDTSTRIGMPAFRKPTEARNELLLRYHQQVVTVKESVQGVVLGRGEDCHLIVHNKLASRQHARIEYGFGKFLLTDHSANGTYIRFSDQQIIQLNQQQIVLHGSGAISLGQSFSDNFSDVIEYLVQ